jgi:hypothetical protein
VIPPHLRPRTAPEIADAAVQLGRRHFRPLFALAALVALPGMLLSVVQVRFVPTPTMGEPLGEFAPAVFMILALGMGVFLIGLGAVVRSVAAAYLDDRALEPLAAIRIALGRAPRLLLASLLAYVYAGLLMGLWVLVVSLAGGVVGALITPAIAGSGLGAVSGVLVIVLGFAVVAGTVLVGLLLLARYVNVTAVVMLEERGPVASVRRASELSRGSLRRSALLLFLIGVLYALVYVAVWAIAGLLLRDENLGALVASVVTIPLSPFLAAVLVVLYYDLRIRREGLDLELLADALDAPVDGAPAAGGAR